MEAYRSVIMEAIRDRFVAAELLSYKGVLFVEATEEWYAQRGPVEVDLVECDCIRQVEQFAHLVEEYLENDSLPMYSFNHPKVWLPLAQTLYITAG